MLNQLFPLPIWTPASVLEPWTILAPIFQSPPNCGIGRAPMSMGSFWTNGVTSIGPEVLTRRRAQREGAIWHRVNLLESGVQGFRIQKTLTKVDPERRSSATFRSRTPFRSSTSPSQRSEPGQGLLRRWLPRWQWWILQNFRGSQFF